MDFDRQNHGSVTQFLLGNVELVVSITSCGDFHYILGYVVVRFGPTYVCVALIGFGFLRILVDLDL